MNSPKAEGLSTNETVNRGYTHVDFYKTSGLHSHPVLRTLLALIASTLLRKGKLTERHCDYEVPGLTWNPKTSGAPLPRGQPRASRFGSQDPQL